MYTSIQHRVITVTAKEKSLLNHVITNISQLSRCIRLTPRFLWLMFCLLFMPTPSCSHPVRAVTPVHSALPVLATSPTDRVAAAFRSSGEPRRGLVPGTPDRRVQPALASLGRLPVPRTHPAGPVRRAEVLQAANPARLVAIGMIAVGRSPAIG